MDIRLIEFENSMQSKLEVRLNVIHQNISGDFFKKTILLFGGLNHRFGKIFDVN